MAATGKSSVQPEVPQQPKSEASEPPSDRRGCEDAGPNIPVEVREHIEACRRALQQALEESLKRISLVKKEEEGRIEKEEQGGRREEKEEEGAPSRFKNFIIIRNKVYGVKEEEEEQGGFVRELIDGGLSRYSADYQRRAACYAPQKVGGSGAAAQACSDYRVGGEGTFFTTIGGTCGRRSTDQGGDPSRDHVTVPIAYLEAALLLADGDGEATKNVNGQQKDPVDYTAPLLASMVASATASFASYPILEKSIGPEFAHLAYIFLVVLFTILALGSLVNVAFDKSPKAKVFGKYALLLSIVIVILLFTMCWSSRIAA